MIKRLFYRRTIRWWLYEYLGASNPDFEEIFDWVFKAPWWKVRLRYNCFFKCYKIEEKGKMKKDPLWKDKAEELYRFLS